MPSAGAAASAAGFLPAPIFSTQSPPSSFGVTIPRIDPKISHKKNWGPASKGVAAQFFDISDLSPQGPTASLRLVCFLDADGSDDGEQAYGQDSPLLEYSYYGDVLLDWVVERLANQKGAEGTPLEITRHQDVLDVYLGEQEEL